MRVLVADDLLAVRSALALLLDQEVDLQVTGQVSDSAGLLQAVAHDAPDVILLDWELPGEPAGALVQRLRESHPQMCIIALSSRPEAEIEAMLAGVDAFIDKFTPPEAVLEVFDSLPPQES
ncbi:MAG TPA: response regulator transcription factor [Anaerolineae bacterium]|nr:response regulator transcription factor [Anaerolineae bacterium]